MAVLGAHVTAKTSATNAVCGPSAAQTSTGGAGTIFWVAIGWANGNATAPTITDSKLNAYTQVGSVVSTGALHTAIFRCEAGTGGTLHTWTATFGTAPDAISFFVDEATGCPPSGITDAAPAGFDDAASPYTSNLTGTTSQANELLLSWIFTLSASGTEVLTHGNSFTAIDSQTNANTDITGASSQRTVSSIGSYQSSVTSTGAGTTEAISYIVALKDASGGAAVQVWVKKSAILFEAPLFEEQPQRRRIPITLFRAPDFPPLVQYDTSDLDPAIYDDLRVRRPWSPLGAVQATVQPTLARDIVGFDERALEERVQRRGAFPISRDTPIFTPRRAPEERTCDDLQQRRPWYPGSTDAAPLTRARECFDEAPSQDNLARKPWAPPGVAAVVNAAPNAPRRAVADEAYPDGIQRRAWIPVSGPVPANAPLRVLRPVSDESSPDLVTRRAWIPVSGPIIIPDQPPRQHARVLADDALPDERQRRPWLPVSGPVVPQQQALARPRGVLDEAIEERLARRPWAPPSSDAPIWRAGRVADEPTQEERLARRQWAPVGSTPDAPPRVARVRVADEAYPDGIQRRQWAPPSGPPVVRDNPPLRSVRAVSDERIPDELRARPWIPVSGPVIPQFGGSVRVYYRAQSVRVRIVE